MTITKTHVKVAPELTELVTALDRRLHGLDLNTGDLTLIASTCIVCARELMDVQSYINRLPTLDQRIDRTIGDTYYLNGRLAEIEDKVSYLSQRLTEIESKG